MKRLHPILVLAFLLASCLRPSSTLPAKLEEDPSIVFPAFFAQPAVSPGMEGTVYELDGDTLRALSIATQDLLPPQDRSLPCGSRLESQQYRVVRQGDLFFIRIDEDPRACGRTHPALDSGASYAIHRDGRILRRVMDGAADMTAPADSGVNTTPGEPGAASPGSLGEGPSPFLPSSWQDAGSQVPAPTP
ncbi:hypothetical protein OV208_36220 [Corallococcus sp. bb12-1]|uniref:hypothetical protein n=1 Tax=Corallococcus sp. bb12-1 TaxID=2996784 RepID=UPI00226E3950|nr:hypothetical protein [Corallococcus sp. bb12-1]MCY1046807.1 hypothetical protein [Corallococcus sp. bb12-1]